MIVNPFRLRAQALELVENNLNINLNVFKILQFDYL